MVEEMRQPFLLIGSGIYPKKGFRELACSIRQSTAKHSFGRDGGNGSKAKEGARIGNHEFVWLFAVKSGGSGEFMDGNCEER